MARQSSLLPIPTTGSSIISDEVFRLLVNNVIDYAIFVLDPKGHIQSWNKGAERLVGYTSREIIGKHFRIFYSEADLTANKPALELQMAKASGDFQEEGWRTRKDGSRFWGSVLITRIVDNDGKLLGFGKIIRDLTERRLSDLRYRLLVQGVEDYAIFSMDANGYITSWNVGGERIKGYKPEEIIGKHFSFFYTPEDQARSLPKMVLHTAATQGHFEGEGWRVRRDGTPFWASVVPARSGKSTQRPAWGFRKHDFFLVRNLSRSLANWTLTPVVADPSSQTVWAFAQLVHIQHTEWDAEIRFSNKQLDLSGKSGAEPDIAAACSKGSAGPTFYVLPSVFRLGIYFRVTSTSLLMTEAMRSRFSSALRMYSAPPVAETRAMQLTIACSGLLIS